MQMQREKEKDEAKEKCERERRSAQERDRGIEIDDEQEKDKEKENRSRNSKENEKEIEEETAGAPFECPWVPPKVCFYDVSCYILKPLASISVSRALQVRQRKPKESQLSGVPTKYTPRPPSRALCDQVSDFFEFSGLQLKAWLPRCCFHNFLWKTEPSTEAVSVKRMWNIVVVQDLPFFQEH